MIEQPGHLPPKVAKRPEGVNRNERRTRPAAVATIEVADLRVLQTSPNGLFDSLGRSLMLRLSLSKKVALCGLFCYTKDR